MASAQAMEQFLAEVERRAYKQALYAVRDSHSALDIVQNAMLKLVERYAHKSVEEWPMLFQRILQNQIHDHFRRAKVRDFWVRVVSPLRDEEDEQAHDTLDSLAARQTDLGPRSPEQLVDAQQHLEQIEAALCQLPARQREAFLLRYWEGLDVAETAQVMGCSEGSVKTHSFRAVNALAEKLRRAGIGL